MKSLLHGYVSYCALNVYIVWYVYRAGLKEVFDRDGRLAEWIPTRW